MTLPFKSQCQLSLTPRILYIYERELMPNGVLASTLVAIETAQLITPGTISVYLNTIKG